MFGSSRPFGWGTFGLAVAQGLTEYTGDHKFGRNGAVGTTVETIWTNSTLYAYLTAAALLNLSSSDVNDDVGGTGALTVQIWGLDADYEPQTEVVILTGQVAAPTASKYLRIFRIQVLTVGTGGTNAGIIYAGTGAAGAGVPTVTYARIEIGKDQSQMAMVTVPAGKTAYISSIYFSVGEGKTCNCELAIRPPGGAFNTKWNNELFQANDDWNFDFPYVVTEKSDIECRGTNDVASQSVSAGFEYLLIDD